MTPEDGHMKKVVLVTGAAGFVGSHLVDRLLADGDEVIAVDNLITGRRDNLRHLDGHPNLQVIEEDVEHLGAVPKAVDEVYHLASPASPPDYHAHPFETMHAGAHGTMNLLRLARDHDARFLLASTSEVYGDPEVSPQPEDYWGHVNPVGPRAVYDEAKRFAEAATMAAHREWGLETRIARIFNTYGPRMRPNDGRVVSNFINQALDGVPLTVYGDGQQTRSLCYVDDLVEGLVCMMARGDTRPMNLGNPDERSVLEIADAVRSCTGANVPVTFQPLPEGDPKRRRPVIDRARSVLGWTPTVRLDEGLCRTIEHYREVRSRPAATVEGVTV